VKEVSMPLMPSKRQSLPESTDSGRKPAWEQKFVQIFRKTPAIDLDMAGRYALKPTPLPGPQP
jgi:hypothetical protein